MLPMPLKQLKKTFQGSTKSAVTQTVRLSANARLSGMLLWRQDKWLLLSAGEGSNKKKRFCY